MKTSAKHFGKAVGP